MDVAVVRILEMKRIVKSLFHSWAKRNPSVLKIPFFGPAAAVSPTLDSYTDLTNDEYVRHLLAVLGGWLLRENVAAFEYCIKEMPDRGSIVEIGSFLGLSTNILAYARMKYQRTNPFFTVDPWVFAGSDRPKGGYFSTGTREYRHWVMESFKGSTSLFSRGKEPYTVEAYSKSFFLSWQDESLVEDVWGRRVRLGGPISFAYIDGAHTYDEVREDYLNVDRFLQPGGFIFFDDSSDLGVFEDVKRVVSEVKANSRYEEVFRTPCYCFKKRNIDDH